MSSKEKSSAVAGSGAALVPKLRFPEFEERDGWKEIPLQKLARPVTDRATTGDADNVLSLSGEHGLVLQSEYFGKKIAGDSTDRYLKIRKDDFVYNDRTTKASSFGTIKRLSAHAGGIVSPIYKCFRFQSSENPAFWEWYFESGSHDPALGGLVNEGARAGRFNISVTQFLSTSAWRPDEAEQKKIADCLDSADALISAQGRKVEALRAHKKGLMQQLFPRPERVENGIKIPAETQPRLRFPEFEGAGEWEPRTVGSVCTSFSGGTPNTSNPEFYGGDIPFIRSAEIGKETTELFLTRAGLENSAAKLVKKGDVLVALYGANSGDVAIGRIAGAINQAILCLRSSENGAFLSHFLTHRKDWIIAKYIQGGQGNLSGEIVKSIGLVFPSPTEQQRIADCLTSLDDLIAAETRKLDTLKTHKKGLMQQLFPQVAEDDA